MTMMEQLLDVGEANAVVAHNLVGQHERKQRDADDQ
jgi:hypothetical protein